jgi:hypothetical protein
MSYLTPEEIITRAEISNPRHFSRVIKMTLLGAAMLGFAVGFLTGFLLR